MAYRQPSLAAQKVRRRWGCHQVAKGWDTVEVVDPHEETLQSRKDLSTSIVLPRVRRNHRRSLTGRSVRQPLRRGKPTMSRRSPGAS